MKKNLLIVSLFYLVMGLCINNTRAGEGIHDGSSGDHSNNVVIANVGNISILFENFFRRYSDYIASTGNKDNLIVRQAILTNMINEELLLHFDDQTDVLQNSNFVNDVEWAKKQTTLAYLKDQEIFAKISVNDFELRQAFQRANEQLEARHLYARTEEEVNNLHQLLKIGVGFDELAKQVFTDSILQNNGGYLGSFTWGDMDPAFEETAYSLQVGEISQPVKTDHGYSIIKLENRIPHPLLTETQFLQKKSHLEQVLKIKKKKMNERDYVKRIFNTAEVTFNNNNVQRVLDELTKSSLLTMEFSKTNKASFQCASYRGTRYTRTDLLHRLNALPVYHREKITSLETMKAAIEGFFLQEKLLEIAHHKKYDTLPIVIEEQKKAQDLIFIKHKIQSIVNKAQLSDSLVFEYYKTNAHLFSSENELNIQEIIVADKLQADSLKEMIKSGNDFGVLAEKYSLRKWSAESKGEMGLTPIKKFGMLKDTLWNSALQELIGPVKIENYYGLFKVLNKKPSEPLAFNLIKDQVHQALRSEKQKTIVQDYLVKLQKQVHITVDEHYLSTFGSADYK